ncbi:MAG TPA: dethiobiotin synthase [Candidatus Acidoferrum sp.]|nr:dethiobiotin synthase [Candidatus Acidoferrum sp.]
MTAYDPAKLRRSFFVTGTDTGVGKTLTTCALLHAANNAGLRTAAMKPVAAGAVPTDEGLRNEDALLLQATCNEALGYDEVNPFCLPAAVAPHIAAALAGRRLSVERIAGFCQGVLMRRANVTLIEGAGGWRVPISERETLADLAKQLKLPVLLVVGVRLGCLNHALLTAEAIHRDGLKLAGWIANTLDPDMPEREANIATLVRQLPAPLVATLPWQATPDPAALAAHFALSLLPGSPA